jgi:hypothetical protein
VYNFPLVILEVRPVVTSCNELMLFTLSRFGGEGRCNYMFVHITLNQSVPVFYVPEDEAECLFDMCLFDYQSFKLYFSFRRRPNIEVHIQYVSPIL